MFIVRQKSHPLFVRQLNDLIYKTDITLEMVSCVNKKTKKNQAEQNTFEFLKNEKVISIGLDWILCGCGDTRWQATQHSY